MSLANVNPPRHTLTQPLISNSVFFTPTPPHPTPLTLLVWVCEDWMQCVRNTLLCLYILLFYLCICFSSSCNLCGVLTHVGDIPPYRNDHCYYYYYCHSPIYLWHPMLYSVSIQTSHTLSRGAQLSKGMFFDESNPSNTQLFETNVPEVHVPWEGKG